MNACPRPLIIRTAILLVATLALPACGGSASPTMPSVAGPQVPIRLALAAVTATWIAATGNTHTFDIAADLSATDTSGRGARITTITTELTTAHESQGLTLSLGTRSEMTVFLTIPPGGSISYPHRERTGFLEDGGRVTLRIEASGFDEQGRAFTASSPTVPLVLAFPRR